MKIFTTAILMMIGLNASAASAKWVDSHEYFNDETFKNAASSLSRAFDVGCGDTFCGGSFSNWTSLGFNCSINDQSGVFGDCSWTFAGAKTSIDETTGKLKNYHETVFCSLDFKGLNAQEVVSQISKKAKAQRGSALLNIVIKGKKISIYDQIVDCIP